MLRATGLPRRAGSGARPHPGSDPAGHASFATCMVKSPPSREGVQWIGAAPQAIDPAVRCRPRSTVRQRAACCGLAAVRRQLEAAEPWPFPPPPSSAPPRASAAPRRNSASAGAASRRSAWCCVPVRIAGRRIALAALPARDHLARARAEDAVGAAGVEAQCRQRHLDALAIGRRRRSGSGRFGGLFPPPRPCAWPRPRLRPSAGPPARGASSRSSRPRSCAVSPPRPGAAARLPARSSRGPPRRRAVRQSS